MWRRLLPTVLLCITGGVLATALIAFACLMYAPVRMTLSRGGVSSDDGRGLPLGTVGFNPGQVHEGFGAREDMGYWFHVRDGSASTPKIFGAGIASFRYGWPFHAFATARVVFPDRCSNAEFQAGVNAACSNPTSSDVLPGIIGSKPYRGIPSRVLLPAFAADTVIFSVLIGATLVSRNVVRRLKRRRAGCCTNCGYPLGGSGRCPECGADAISASPTATHGAPIDRCVAGSFGASEVLQ